MISRRTVTFLPALAALLVLLSQAFAARAQEQEQVTLYGASSTQPVIDALIAPLREQHLALTPVYAGSATLARQIELGAPNVSLFISANRQWMDYLDALGLLERGTRRAVASNRLVVIAAADVAVPPDNALEDSDAMRRALDGGRLAIADPDTVPAGTYGREALQSINAWDGLKDHLAPTKDVTGAVVLVARGEAPLGVVYQSDVLRVDGMQIFATFPAASHRPIVYYAALIKGRASAGARKVLDTLTDAQGQAAFRTAGFGPRP